jgi:hypothetical protein
MFRKITLALALVGCSTDSDPSAVDPIAGVTDDPPASLDDPMVADPVDLPSVELDLDGRRDGPGLMVVRDGEALIADPDAGVLLEVRLNEAAEQILVGEEPTRVMRVGPHVFVTLRAVGEVVRLDRRVVDGEKVWAEGARRYVGAEPFGVAMSNHTDGLWVSLSMEDALVELDPGTLEERRRIAIPSEPRGVAVAPEGAAESVFVVSGSAPQLHQVFPDGSVSTRTLPDMRRFVDDGCPDFLLDPRVTGDPVVNDAGDRVVVPSLYMDTHLQDVPIPTTASGDLIPAPGADCRNDPPPPAPDQYYGEPSERQRPAKTGRVNPALVVYDLGAGDVSTLHLGTASTPDCGQNVVRAYPSAVDLYESASGALMAAVAIEGTGNLITVDLDAERTFESDFEVAGGEPSCGSLGLRAVAEEGGAIWGWSFLMRDIRTWPLSSARTFASQVSTSLQNAPLSPLSSDIQRGRLLFYASSLAEMAAADSGISCNSCHFEGRTDGFTWKLPDGPRQTPSLAGHVSSTAPVTWLGEVETVAEEAALTASVRMGGGGGTAADHDRLAAFVDFVRPVERPAITEPDLVAEGRALFYSEQTACGTCHLGDLGTDNQVHRVLDFEHATNTPPLKGVAATAPYFHDGSAATLRDVLLRVRDGSMGSTAGLSDHQLDALEAYLIAQ